MIEARMRRARDEARRWLHQLGMRKPEHIDPVVLASELGIEIVQGGLEAATARIFRVGSRARIRVSDRIVLPGRRRFTIAHECAHLVLGHTLPRESDLTSLLSRECQRRKTATEDPEGEANEFAAEFCTPERMVRRHCEVSPVTLAPVRAIAEMFTSSPVASAFRFAELSSERCAAVYAEQGRVKWRKPSPTFPDWIHKGMRLSAASIGFDYFKKGRIDDAAQWVPADAWCETIDSALANVEIMEHAEAVPEWNGVLSMVWIPESAAGELRLDD